MDVLYGEGGCYSVVVKNDVMSIRKWHSISARSHVGDVSKKLTSIGWQAFSGCRDLTSVTFPKELTSIGDSAFYDCTGLTSVTFREGLTNIEESAFSMHRAHLVTFPEGLTSIGRRAFYRCIRLTSVTFQKG